MSTIVFSPTEWAVNKTEIALRLHSEDSLIKKGLVAPARFIASSALIATGLLELISFIALTIISSPARIFKTHTPLYHNESTHI